VHPSAHGGHAQMKIIKYRKMDSGNVITLSLRRMKRFIRLAWILVCCLVALTATGQPIPETDASKQIQIIKSDRAIVESVDGLTTRYLAGQVRLFHRDAYLLCDSAVVADEVVRAYGDVVIIQDDSIQIFADSLVYDGERRMADLYGEVVMKNGQKRLYSKHINYLLDEKFATYDRRSMLTDDKTKISSNRGEYYLATSDAFFKDSVIIDDPSFKLKTDTLRYNTDEGIAFFLAPTIILQDSAKIYTEGGYYDTKLGKAAFTNRPQYLKGLQKATADSILYDRNLQVLTLLGKAAVSDSTTAVRADRIVYDRATDETRLEGNAYYKSDNQEVAADSIRYNNKTEAVSTRGRSTIAAPPQFITADAVDYDKVTGAGVAYGHVFYSDTSAGIRVFCDSTLYDRSRDFLQAWGGRPLMSLPMDGDTLWVRADTLLSQRKAVLSMVDSTITDSVRYLNAFHQVRMYSKQFEGLCDSLAFNDRDSVFILYNDPILWSDNNQFEGDTIEVYIKNNKADRMILKRNAFLITNEGDERFNQIKGQTLTALFADGDLYKATVEGNAESLYYAEDDNGGTIGLNKTTSGSIALEFEESKAKNIRFYGAPVGNLSPVRKVPVIDRKLKDFVWRIAEKPGRNLL
jgi:lipopolysaccharide export system protein LptA